MHAGKLASIALVLLLAGSTAAVQYALADGQKPLQKLIGMLEETVKRLRQAADKVEDPDLRDFLVKSADKAQGLLDETKKLVEEGKVEDAAQRVREAMETLRVAFGRLKGPRESGIGGAIARLRGLLERLRKALRVAEERGLDVGGIRELLERAEDLLKRAEEALRRGDLDEARRLLGEAREAVGKALRMFKNLGEEALRRSLGKVREAVGKFIEKLAKVDPEKAEELRERAERELGAVEKLIEEGRYREAAWKMRELIREIARLSSALSKAKRLLELAKLAEDVAERVKGRHPQLAETLKKLSADLRDAIKDGDLAEALRKASQIVRLLRSIRRSVAHTPKG